MTEDPIGTVVASAGKALEALAVPSADHNAGWELDLDAPQVTVDDDAAWPTQVAGGILAALAVALTVVLLFVLKDLLVHNWPHQHAATIVLAGGIVALALLVACAAWRTLAYSGARVHIKLRKLAPISPAATGLTAATFTQLLAQMATPATGTTPAGTPAPTTQPSAGAGGTATTATPSKSPVAKEPVIVGTGLLAAGTLAIGFAANLGAEEVAAIAAGSSALIGLLLRQQVTPVAEPKDAKNQPLTPAGAP